LGIDKYYFILLHFSSYYCKAVIATTKLPSICINQKFYWE